MGQAKYLTKKLKALQQTAASLQAGQAAAGKAEVIVPATPPAYTVGDGKQMGGRAGRAAHNT